MPHMLPGLFKSTALRNSSRLFLPRLFLDVVLERSHSCALPRCWEDGDNIVVRKSGGRSFNFTGGCDPPLHIAVSTMFFCIWFTASWRWTKPLQQMHDPLSLFKKFLSLRYRAVSRPIQYSRQSQNVRRVIYILIVIWLISLIVASPIVLGELCFHISFNRQVVCMM